MAVHPHSQNVIALIWDFDKTLIPGLMQEPVFARYRRVKSNDFWNEVQALPAYYRAHGEDPIVSPDALYLSHILTYVRAGLFKGLNNRILRESGARLKFFPGLPAFFPKLKRTIEDEERFREHGITLEHYIVSSGLRQVILGSAISKHVEDVWACEFVEDVAPPGFGLPPAPASRPSKSARRELAESVYVIDSTTKTRAVFEINKGVNKAGGRFSVNATIAPEHRRVPFENMIYIADGPSDVPVFSLVNQNGGHTYAVYKPRSDADFSVARELREQGRVQAMGEADYRNGTTTNLWLSQWAEEIADRIVARSEAALAESVGAAPEHAHEPDRETEAPHDRLAGFGGGPPSGLDEPDG